MTVSVAHGQCRGRSAMPQRDVLFTASLLAISILLPAVNTDTKPAKPQLTFAENLFATFSSACRAMMDLRYGHLKGPDDSVKTLKIVQLGGDVIRTFPIDEAFSSLTKDSLFDISKQTKIVIHGFGDNAQSAVPLDLARAYVEKGMFNVILVDAQSLTSQWYLLAVHNARLVGKRLGNLLANLENFGANAEDFHLLGISLGAHIAGWAGKYFSKYKGRRLGRITGLDPAGPCFTNAYSDQRLDMQDAVYVDVVHTNRLVQGVMEPLGHADFYINGGGPMQPGCFIPPCSHLRAAQLYAESVRIPKSIVGVKCKSWKHFMANSCEENFAVLGYGSSTSTRGLYYLRTSSKTPYGLSMEGTKYKKNNWMMDSIPFDNSMFM